MEKKWRYMVRIVGGPAARRYLLQRSDGKFWGSMSRWVVRENKALVYRTVREAQAGCRPFINRQTRGEPRRQFACTLSVSVIGNDTDRVTADDVADYLRKALVMGIDYEMRYDGPLADQHVEVRARVGSMAEVVSVRLRDPSDDSQRRGGD